MTMSRDWMADAEAWLQDCFDRAVLAKGESGLLKIDPALSLEEAEWLMRGRKARLFAVDDAGYVASALLPPPREGTRQQKTVQLFWHHAGGRRLFREGVCQMAAGATLVLECGWTTREVYFEPSRTELGDLAYGVDLLVREADEGRVVICCEVKRSSAELDKLLSQMRACGSIPPHDRGDCDSSDASNHPKMATCRQERPSYFWAVCPGRREAYEVRYEGDLVDLRRIDELPERADALMSVAE